MSSNTIFPAFSVIECAEEHSAKWDSFVGQAGGTYCHLFGWKQVIEHTYGLRSHYIALRSCDTWLGILPVAIMPRLPGSHVKAVSLPYCNYGGLLAAPGVDTESLQTAAINYLTSLGVEKIELRDLSPNGVAAMEVTMVLSLPENTELLWKLVGDKVRNQVRKAQRSGLTLRWGPDQGDELYAIYAKNMGRLGTPVHSPRYIKETLSNFPGVIDVLTVRLDDRPIGAMLLFKYGKTWADPIASCLTEFNSLNPNMLLYYEAVRASCEAGAKFFDFGRSRKDSGTYRFKKQWGAREVGLNYHSYRKGKLDPAASTDFYRSKNASTLALIWKYLPAVMQENLGPVVRRWLP